MVEINFYQSGGFNASLQFPQEWNELHLQELHAISKNLLTEFKQQLEGKASILFDLIRLRSKQHKIKLPKDFENNLNMDDAVISGLPLVDFIYQTNTLTKNPYPKITSLYGPADEFNDFTCGEFEDCEIFFNEFHAEASHESLAHLASILWRPRRSLFSHLTSHVSRLPYITYKHRTATYVTYNAEKHYQYFLKQPSWVLHTIFTWYSGCRLLLPQYFPTIHKKGDGEPDMAAFTKCIHAGAGPKNGSRDQIRCTLLKEFFYEMELEAVKAEEQQREIEKLRRR